MIKADYRDCVELADQICESIEKADGSWVYEGDDLPGQIVPHLQPVIGELQALRELAVKEGPLNTESWTLDKLLAQLQKWRTVAGGTTCVSFESLCYGASSLWHQTHRKNFREVDRKPEALSEWVLKYAGSVRTDFPEQVLEILKHLHEENQRLKPSAG